VAFCSYNLSSILNGLIYFDQYDSLSTKQVCLVMLGICILLGGVWALSQQDEVDDAEGETGEVTPVNGGIHQGDWDTRVIVGEDMNLTPPSSPMSALPSRPLPPSGGREGVPGAGRLASGRRAASSPASFMFPSSSSMAPIDVESSTLFSDDTGMAWPPTGQAPLSVSQTTAQQTSATKRNRRRSTVRFSPTFDAASGAEGESGHGGTPLVGGFTIGLSPLSPGFSLALRPRRQDSEASLVGQQHGGQGEREQRGTETDLVEDQNASKRSGIMRRRWNGLRRIIWRER